MAEVTAADVARRIDVPPATLRRWVRSGLVPLPDGTWTPAAIAQARIVARLRERGHTMAQIRAAAEGGRLAYGYLEELFPGGPGPALAARRRRAHRPRAGADPAHLELARVPGGHPRRLHRRGRRAARVRRGGAADRLPARRVPAAHPRLRPGARPDRRRRGQAVPPLRPRAADARRRARPGDGRGDGDARRRPAAARGADDGRAAPPAPAATSSSRTSSGTWRPRPTSTSAGCGWRSRSPTSPATRG